MKRTIELSNLGFLPICLIILISINKNSPQSELNWSNPYLLNQEPGVTPIILSDSSGIVHVFWGTKDRNDNAIFYSRMKNDIWTMPIDIITIPDDKAAVAPNAVIDQEGQIHLVWESGRILYSKAHISHALSPRGWSFSRMISDGPAVLPILRIDKRGDLHIVYISLLDPPNVRYTYSIDGGNNWTAPLGIPRSSETAFAVSAQLVIDDNDIIHVVWSESEKLFPPSGIFYSNSRDRGINWISPVPIAIGGFTYPSIFLDSEETIHVFWTGTAEWIGKYHTYSIDRGKNWQPNERLWPGTGGILGFADYAIDSANGLHLVAPAGGQFQFPFPSRGEILHSMWIDKHWTIPDHVSEMNMKPDYEQNSPSITISMGNVVNIVWNGNYKENWYSKAILNIPEEKPVPIPTLDSSLESQKSEKKELPSSKPSIKEYKKQFDAVRKVPTNQEMTIFFWGIVPVLFFLLLRIVIRLRRHI